MPRGRKRKERADAPQGAYFTETEEKAVIDYLNAESDEEKAEIFRTKLYQPLYTMAEGIVRRYKLAIPDEEVRDTFEDCISFLITKVEKYNPYSNSKAYSYFGTIIKNYLIYKINAYYKNRNRSESFEKLSPFLSEDEKYVDEKDQRYEIHEEIIKQVTTEIRDMIDNKIENELTDEEIIVGKALITTMENLSDFVSDDASNKFNKSSILLSLQEMTNMPTKKIRDNMKKFKPIYFNAKENILKLLQ